jgi:hypothetical protein
MNEDSSKPGEPKDPIDEYDSSHGAPCEEDVRSNPTNQPDFGPRSFNVSK